MRSMYGLRIFLLNYASIYDTTVGNGVAQSFIGKSAGVMTTDAMDLMSLRRHRESIKEIYKAR